MIVRINMYLILVITLFLQNRSPSDDSLPDGIADVLHNMSHALHALSDVTFNFHSPDPQRVSCLPRITPVSVPPHPRSSSSNDATQSTTSSNAAGSNGQPHFHPSPHVHVHGSNMATSASSTAPHSNQPIRPSIVPATFGVSLS